MTWVVDLAEIRPGSLARVGGKGLNLGIMTAAGLPVPDGFCVTTEAYDQVVGSTLEAQVAEPERGGNPARLRERIVGLAIPPEVAEAVRQRYHHLGRATAVAVRSSATAEDLAYASSAGQQDTYLNVVGDEAVLDAVRRCWASLWTDRAVSYRTGQGVDHLRVSLAVVVQRMVDADVAGVMFTANPVTGTRHETVIDASPGLGEAVVSGAVNPDHFVVDRPSQTVRERRRGDTGVRVVADSGGTGIVRDDTSTAACLTDPRCWSWRPSASGCRTTTRPPRTSSGRSTAAGSSG